ncbi:MAG: DUF5678 domain-containing protein [Candidatus Bathyarchaeia archaeon]
MARRVELKKKRFFVAIDFSRYKGRYVAVVGKRVVASGTNAKQVWLEAKRKNPKARPELHKVPKDETLVLIDQLPTFNRSR